MAWVGLIGGAGVGVLAIIAAIIAIRFARSRDERCDAAADKLEGKVVELDAERIAHALTKTHLHVANANTATLTVAVATQKDKTAEVARGAAALEESFHALLETLKAAPASAVAAASAAAMARLRADLARLRAQAEAVPAVPAAAPAENGGGGKDPGLPRAPHG